MSSCILRPFISLISLLIVVFFLCIGYGTVSQDLGKEQKRAIRNARKQEKIDQGKLLIIPLAGPAYTPEMKFTIAGGVMMSYRTNPTDSIIQRSSSPIMLVVSSTGAIFLGNKVTSFLQGVMFLLVKCHNCVHLSICGPTAGDNTVNSVTYFIGEYRHQIAKKGGTLSKLMPEMLILNPKEVNVSIRYQSLFLCLSTSWIKKQPSIE